MEELSGLAARVWKRVARGEAYDIKPAPKAKPAASGCPSEVLLLLLIVLCINRNTR